MMMNGDHDDDDNFNGQFRPGQSGNPLGRPKGSKNTATMTNILLAEELLVKVDGRYKYLPAGYTMIRKVGKKAIQGDLKPIFFLLEHMPEDQLAQEKIVFATKGLLDGI